MAKSYCKCVLSMSLDIGATDNEQVARYCRDRGRLAHCLLHPFLHNPVLLLWPRMLLWDLFLLQCLLSFSPKERL